MDAQTSLDRVLAAGVPIEALSFFGRWWQLERWLREMVYVELRAKYGPAWTAHLSGPAPNRASADVANAYMASADASDLLSYADAPVLFRLVLDQWDLFSRYLPSLARWRGSADLLLDLRNRIAHCRRPHRDDLGRIEQMLRDLEPGARLFYDDYNRVSRLLATSRDAIARAWVVGEHEAAVRLLEHASDQYGTRFSLGYSIQPWAEAADHAQLDGTAGVIWHASWTVSGDSPRPVDLWAALERQEVRLSLIHLIFAGGCISATLSALQPEGEVADVIGQVFDAILPLTRRSRPPAGLGIEEMSAWWHQDVDSLPSQVQVGSALALYDGYHDDLFSIFGA